MGRRDVLPGLVVRLLPEGLEDLGAGSEAATGDARHRRAVYAVQRSGGIGLARRPAQHRGAAVPIASGYRAGAAASRPRLWISWRRIRVRPFGTVYGATYSMRSGRGSSAYFAQMKVTVDAHPVTDLTVTLRRGASIRGKFVTETGEPLSNTAPSVYAEPADGNLGLGMPSSGAAGVKHLRNPRFTGRPVLAPIPRLRERIGLVGRQPTAKITGTVPFDGSLGRDFDVVVTLTGKRTDSVGDRH